MNYITQRQIQLVDESWDYLILKGKESEMNFYDTLFSLDPTLRQYFNGDVEIHLKKLVGMITLEKFDDVTKGIVELGQKHDRHIIKQEFLVTVGKALLSTLERGLGDKWNRELNEAWSVVYNTLVSTIIHAAKELEQQHPVKDNQLF